MLAGVILVNWNYVSANKAIWYMLAKQLGGWLSTLKLHKLVLFSSAFSFKLKKQGGSNFHVVPNAIFVQANYGAK
jgi:hypothetical protein